MLSISGLDESEFFSPSASRVKVKAAKQTNYISPVLFFIMSLQMITLENRTHNLSHT